MKLVVTVIITLGAAVGFALIAMEDPGYVVLARSPYTVRLPLALFVLGLLAVFAGLYLLFNFIAALLRAPRKAREWNQRRNQARAQAHTTQGYAGLIEGEWSKAEKKLLSHLPDNRSPLLNYLGAAYAAQQRGHLQRRDQYLADALEQHPEQRLAIRLTTARLHYQAGEIAESRDALEKLRRVAPKNVPAARLLADAYRQLKDWNSLAALMPSLARLKAFPPFELARRERQAYQHYLSSPALLQGSPNRNRPLEAFKSLPAAQQKNPKVIAGYARQLLRAGDHARAEKTLRLALNRGWDAELAGLYGRAETAFTDDQILLTESWLKKYGDHAHAHDGLTLTLARLCRRDGRLGKAKELFSRVISGGGHDDACAELGSLLEEMGDKDAALLCYRRGMAALAPEWDAGELPPVPVGELVTLDARESAEPAGGADVMPVVR